MMLQTLVLCAQPHSSPVALGIGEEEFSYDHVFENFTNYAVYSILGKRVLQSIFDGYNSCVFAYGQTGRSLLKVSSVASLCHALGTGLVP